MKNLTDHKKLRNLSSQIIKAAVNGDPEAIDCILSGYEGYIFSLATKQSYDKVGNTYAYVDYELFNHLKFKLVMKILEFDTA